MLAKYKVFSATILYYIVCLYGKCLKSQRKANFVLRASSLLTVGPKRNEKAKVNYLNE